MFEKAWPFAIYIKKHKVKLLAAILFLGGAGAVIYGGYKLQELQHQEYELKPVWEGCAPQESQASQQQDMYIDISGAVNKPGLYQVPPESRLGYLIDKAGGFQQEADSHHVAVKLNLAQVLKDGDKIFVPSRLDEEVPAPGIEGGASRQEIKFISINQATEKDLTSLPGIGEKRASDIASNRPYDSLEELVSKEVVTQSIYEQLEGLVSL